MGSGRTMKHMTRNHFCYSARCNVGMQCSSLSLEADQGGALGGHAASPVPTPSLSSGDKSHEYMHEHICEHIINTYMKTGMRICEYTYMHMHIDE